MKIKVPNGKVFFYTLSDPLSGDVKYIGKTWTSLSERLSGHISGSKKVIERYEDGISKRKPSKLYSWIEDMRRDGKRPEIKFLSEGDREEWQFFEIYWIEQFKSWGFDLVNSSKGGLGSSGHKQSKETRLKKSIANKGKKPSIRAVKASIEYNNKKVRQYTKDMEFLKEWESIKTAYEATGIHYNAISNVVCNRAKTAGGFVWTIN